MIRTKTAVDIQVAVARLLKTVSIAARIVKPSSPAASSPVNVDIPSVAAKLIDGFLGAFLAFSKARHEEIATSNWL